MDDTILFIELFIKCALSNRGDKGCCLIGQQWFMTLYELVKKGLINLKVIPTSLEMPPPEYEQLNAARHLPIACIVRGKLNGADVSGATISTNESLEVLMADLGCPCLVTPDQESKCLQAERHFENLYRNTLLYLRNNDRHHLDSSFVQLNEYLATIQGPYLMGSSLSYVDCQLMPKLQHIRVVCRVYKQFDIPITFKNIWSYLKVMYATEAFICSCPSDRDLLMHYDKKIPLPKFIKPGLIEDGCLKDLPAGIDNGQECGQKLR